MMIEQQQLCDAFSPCVMWRNHRASSSIGWTGVNSDDSHPGVSSKLLIKDQSSNSMVMPNFCLFILSFFDGIKYS